MDPGESVVLVILVGVFLCVVGLLGIIEFVRDKYDWYKRNKLWRELANKEKTKCLKTK